jgi:hypothetical protein
MEASVGTALIVAYGDIPMESISFSNAVPDMEPPDVRGD